MSTFQLKIRETSKSSPKGCRATAECSWLCGAVLLQARWDKETTYPELASSGRCKLVVLAIETGGRWSEEAVQTMKMLAHSKARDAQSYMQFPVALMWERRWTRMLAMACAVSFVASLVEPRTDGETPLLAALFECDPR